MVRISSCWTLLAIILAGVSSAVAQDLRTESLKELVKRLEETEHRLLETESRLKDAEKQLKTIPGNGVYQQSGYRKAAAQPSRPWIESNASNVVEDVQLEAEGIEAFSWNKSGGWSVKPFGKLEVEGIFTNDATVSENYVVFAQPLEAIRTDQVDVTGQSTQIGLDIAGPSVGRFKVGGMILMDFHGNRPARNEPGAYFIRGYAELINDDWRIAFGQMGDTIEGWNAEVVNWQGLGGLGYIGANQRGTFRVDRFLTPNSETKWTLTGALTQPVVTDLAGIQDVFGQDNGLPNFEGKIVWGRGCDCGEGQPFQMSLAGMYGQTNAVARSLPGFPLGVSNVSDTYAVAGAMQWVGRRFGARGQIWSGRGIGTYMGGISQSLNLETGDAINAQGGYGQVWVDVTERVRFSFFGGVDDPRDSDLSTLATTNQRRRNRVLGGNATWFINDFFHVRCDIMGVATDYVQPETNNDVLAVMTEASISY